jgi:hypothetical protein
MIKLDHEDPREQFVARLTEIAGITERLFSSSPDEDEWWVLAERESALWDNLPRDRETFECLTDEHHQAVSAALKRMKRAWRASRKRRPTPFHGTPLKPGTKRILNGITYVKVSNYDNNLIDDEDD